MVIVSARRIASTSTLSFLVNISAPFYDTVDVLVSLSESGCTAMPDDGTGMPRGILIVTKFSIKLTYWL